MRGRRCRWPLGVLAALAAVAAVVVPAAGAAAAEVSLRVEAPSETLYEGPVATGDAPLDGRDGTGAHACGAGAGAGAALQASGLAWRGRWNADFQDFFLDQVAGHASDPDELAYWSILVDWRYALGMCRAAVSDGSEVLFALGVGPSPKVLRLYGPARVRSGESLTVTVRDGWIRGGTGIDGGPVEGASVGGAVTDSDGRARLALGADGLHRLKATMPGAVRSNALEVCVGDGPCDGSPAPPDDDEPPRDPLIRTPAPGERYAFRASTRLLRGSAEGPVRVRLEGSSGRRCAKLSASGVMRRRSCRRRAPMIQLAADRGEWRLRLRGPLAPGRYRLAVRSGTEAAARRFSVAARPRTVRRASRAAVRWLSRVQGRDGSFGLGPRTPASPLATDWAAIALGRSAPRSSAFRRALRPVRAEARRGLSPLTRAALALAPSRHRRDRVRLRAYRRRIVRLQRRDGSWSGQAGSTAYALAALRGGGHAAAFARGRAWLAAQPLAPDADTIGATLWALRGAAPRRAAIEALRGLQADDGGFAAQPGDAANSQSTALAVLGLRSAGVNPRRLRSETGISPLGCLRARQRPGGRVDYRRGEGGSSVWVTAQTLLALSPVRPQPQVRATSD